MALRISVLFPNISTTNATVALLLIRDDILSYTTEKKVKETTKKKPIECMLIHIIHKKTYALLEVDDDRKIERYHQKQQIVKRY